MSAPETEKLLQIVARLRKECPWDRKQTHRTLVPYLLEEAYETLEAIRGGDEKALREELGDLLLQIVLHAEIASEKGAFTFEEVAKGIGDKMVRRHPHVYSDEKVGDKKQHSQRWTELKQKEKPKRSMLEGTPRSMPALQLCQRYGEIVASVGFDWDDVEGIWGKLKEEIRELDVEIKARKASKKKIAEELGDVIFCISQLARHLKLNAELVGRDSASKFGKRFAQMEAEARTTGEKISKRSPQEWEKAWQRSKRKTRR